jgi:hypothetical protein
MIGKAKNPRCFRKRQPGVAYFNQAKAWSDTVTFNKWFSEVFLPHVRSMTSKPVLLIMDNCSSHTGLVDNRDQVKIIELPPNCTSVHQPMDQGIIASFKVRYRTRLLATRADTMLVAADLRKRAKERKMTAGSMGLAEGHDPHVLDVADMALLAWKDVQQESIARCWLKANILPPMMQAALSNEGGRGVRRGATDPDVAALSDALSAISVSAAEGKITAGESPEGELVEALECLGMAAGQPPSDAAITAALEWVRLEDGEDMTAALRSDMEEEIMQPMSAAVPEEQDLSDEEPEVQEVPGSSSPKAPPPYHFIAPAFEMLEQVVDDCNLVEAAILLSRVKLELISAHSRRHQQQTVMRDYFPTVPRPAS